MITARSEPVFGGVYKLAAIKKPEDEEFTAKIKSQAVNMFAWKLPAFVVYTFAHIKADVIRAPV